MEGIMLILTRRTGESLQIGDNVKITVLSIRGNQVQIGIDAPANVAVHREEIYARIQREHEAKDAGQTRSGDRLFGKSKRSTDR